MKSPRHVTKIARFSNHLILLSLSVSLSVSLSLSLIFRVRETLEHSQQFYIYLLSLLITSSNGQVLSVRFCHARVHWETPKHQAIHGESTYNISLYMEKTPKTPICTWRKPKNHHFIHEESSENIH